MPGETKLKWEKKILDASCIWDVLYCADDSAGRRPLATTARIQSSCSAIFTRNNQIISFFVPLMQLNLEILTVPENLFLRQKQCIIRIHISFRRVTSEKKTENSIHNFHCQKTTTNRKHKRYKLCIYTLNPDCKKSLPSL